jgi:isoleucyl-tRNA synthetase
MELTRKIVELGLARRDEAGIKIRQMLAKMTIALPSALAKDYYFLIKDELNIQEVILNVKEGTDLAIELDTEITPELKKEGIKRDLIRFINRLRQQSGLSLQDVTSTLISGNSIIEEVISKFNNDIKKETLSESLTYTENMLDIDFSYEVKIDGETVVIALKK